MEESIQKAAVLIEALPYFREFEGKTVVIKYGGSAMVNADLRKVTAADIVLMRHVGMNPVVVHGGGPAIGKHLEQLGIESRFHKGLRITDDETMAVVEMVLAGSVNKDVVSLLNRAGGRAAGLCGKDGKLLHAKQVETRGDVDLGNVGDITHVQPEIIQVLCGAGIIPVVAPIATDSDGHTYNVNADSAAGEIAAALDAEKLVFLTDAPGLLMDMNDPETLIHELPMDKVAELKEEGVIAGGMIPKVDACIRALGQGVRKTHIVDGRISHALLLEIFTKKGLGTLVTH